MQHIVSAVDHLHKAGIIHRYTPKIERVLFSSTIDSIYGSTTQINGQTPPSRGGVWGTRLDPPLWRAGSDRYFCLVIIVAMSNRTNFLLALEVLGEILQFGA